MFFLPKLLLILGGVLTLLYAPHAAYAQSQGGLEVSPAIIEVTLDKNREERIPLTFTNHSNQFLSLEIFPIDFKQQDGTGAISFLGQEPGSYSYSLSSFLSFASTTVELGPKSKETLLVTVRDREDLSPGGHYAAVVAKVVSDSVSRQTQIAPSVSSLILLRKVGGERFNFSLKDVDFPQGIFSFRYPRRITLTFQNEGNIHLVPYGRVEVKDITNRLIYKGIINASSVRVFPSSRRFIYADMDKIARSMPVSLNTVTVTGQDSLKKTTYSYREVYLYVSPLFLLLGLIITIGLGAYGLRKKAANRDQRARRQMLRDRITAVSSVSGRKKRT